MLEGEIWRGTGGWYWQQRLLASRYLHGFRGSEMRWERKTGKIINIRKTIKEMEEEYETLHTYDTMYALVNIKRLDSEKYFLFAGIVLLVDFSNYVSMKNRIRDQALAADEKQNRD